VEVVRSQGVEDDVDMLQVFGPGGTIDQDVIKNTSIELRKYGRRTSFINAWKVAGALERPNDITKNS